MHWCMERICKMAMAKILKFTTVLFISVKSGVLLNIDSLAAHLPVMNIGEIVTEFRRFSFSSANSFLDWLN